jgi:hypothetical protein
MMVDLVSVSYPPVFLIPVYTVDEASKNWKLSRRLPADFLELHASCYRTRSSITTFVGMTSLGINSPLLLLLPLPLLLLLLAAIRPCGGFPPPRPPRR